MSNPPLSLSGVVRTRWWIGVPLLVILLAVFTPRHRPAKLPEPSASAVVPAPLPEIEPEPPAPVANSRPARPGPGRCEHPLNPALPGLFSNAGGQKAASSFRLEHAMTPVRLTWYGIQTAKSATEPFQGAFRIRLMRDEGGIPSGNMLFDRTIPARSAPSGIRFTTDPGKPLHHGREISRHEADLAGAPVLEAGVDHWVSISAVGAASWLWARSGMDTPHMAHQGREEDSPWKSSPRLGRAAFILEGVPAR